jgi:2-polyprenyl-3-methyl-5-hydroxy-6-metoxy-1,4-benzoquinol methylase
MTAPPKYDRHYRADPAACGAPFPVFAAFCEGAPPGRVLDLGCGQGRDALMFARAGHSVVGVDISAVGVGQLKAAANAENLDLDATVADIRDAALAHPFDTVILDRVLHMLPAPDRGPMLQRAMAAVAPGGHLLVAEGPKGMVPVRAAAESQGWELVQATRNRLIARRPCPDSRP